MVVWQLLVHLIGCLVSLDRINYPCVRIACTLAYVSSFLVLRSLE